MAIILTFYFPDFLLYSQYLMQTTHVLKHHFE